MGYEITVWTARVAFACYILSIWCEIRHEQRTTARLFWTAGVLVHGVHVLCALGFVHHWNQLDAYQHTADVTERVVGLHWGGGLYVNYVFTAIWIADAAWWWINRTSYENRSRVFNWSIHGFFAFVFFNATVVFAPTMTRIGASLAWVCVALARIASPRRRRRGALVAGRPGRADRH